MPCVRNGFRPQTNQLKIQVMRNLREKTYVGKEERINGEWYSVTVKAYSYREAVKMLYKGQRKSYGVVEAVRGRFYEEK